MLRNKTKCDPIIGFYWDTPSLKLTAAPDSRDNDFKGKDITCSPPSSSIFITTSRAAVSQIIGKWGYFIFVIL